MTINQILNIVDQMKPNAFPPEVKVMWINEVEGYVQTYIHLVSSADVITYDYSVDAETELLVPPPHNGVYWTFLTAMIDYGNGEYNKYQNTITLYNNYMAEYQRWYATVYRPADGEMEIQGYYLSAYAIAVKHGFSGSEEDWIASLKGEKGDPGERGLDGEGLNIVGFYDTYDALEAGVPNPTPGEAYGVGAEAPYVIYIWDRVSLTWKNNGTIKGEPGTPGSNGKDGSDGTTFTPSVDNEGNLSWSNADGKPNPETKNIRGPAGKDGAAGKDGNDGQSGSDGTTFTPSVDDEGNLSWSNADGKQNPPTKNIRGPAGVPGKDGKGLKVLAYYNTETELRANVVNPEAGDAYGVGYADPYDIYMFDGDKNDWVNNGPLQGAKGEDGTTFTPSVDDEGNLSWSNADGKDNPPTKNIRGPAGADGAAGKDGSNGQPGNDGTTFTPSVDNEGNLSWSNEDGKQNPPTKNIRGPAGADGAAGKDGSDGQPGNDGTTFTPAVDDEGNLSWNNNGGLPNPETVNIKGPEGPMPTDYVPLSGAKMTGTLDFDGTSNPVDFGTSGYIRGKTTSGSKFDIFGYTNPTNLQVGGTYPTLSLKGKDARPTYNGSEMALLNDVQSGCSATSQTVTLLASGWTNNGDGRYVQTVAVTGVTESTPIVIVDVALYSNNADENALIIEAVYQTDGSIMQQPVVQGAGTLTFYSASVPTVNIPVFVGVIG